MRGAVYLGYMPAKTNREKGGAKMSDEIICSVCGKSTCIFAVTPEPMCHDCLHLAAKRREIEDRQGRKPDEIKKEPPA